MAHQLPTLPSAQQGAAGGIISTIILLILLLKLVIAIVPAQLNDRSISSTIANELQKSNQKKENKRVFLNNLRIQAGVNRLDIKPEEMFTFTNENPGNLTIHTNYQVENEFFPTVYITNKFERDITGADTLK